jgi:hypothetical protein
MRAVYLWSVVLLLLSGCAVLETLSEHSEEIEATGEVVETVGTGLSIAQPQMGLIVLLAGGLIIAAGKLLKQFK